MAKIILTLSDIEDMFGKDLKERNDCIKYCSIDPDLTRDHARSNADLFEGGRYPVLFTLFETAYSWAGRSKDPSSKVGSVLSIGGRGILEGFNGFPHGTKDTEERLNNRELKYPRVVHAEANCIAFAARKGIAIEGAAMISTHHPCPTCAGMCVAAGITRVFFDMATFTPAFRERMNVEAAAEIFADNGIPVYGIEIPLNYKD